MSIRLLEYHNHAENSKTKSIKISKTFLFLASKQGGPTLAIFSCSKKYDPGKVWCALVLHGHYDDDLVSKLGREGNVEQRE